MPQVVTQMKSGAADAPTAVSPGSTSIPNRDKALKILSKSIYKEMRQNGYEPKQIVALATELISEVTTKMARGDKQQQVA